MSQSSQPVRKTLAFGALLLILIGTYLYLTRPIKIGVLFSLDSSVGNEENLAVQFYNNEFPNIGFRKVKLIVENPPLDKDSITDSFNRLDSQGVSAIIGSALSFEGIVLAKLSAEKKIPVISPSASTSILSGKKDRYYRICITNYEQGRHPAKYLNSINVRKVVMLLSRQNRAFSEPLADAFMENFSGESIKVFNDPQKPDPEKILEYQADCVFFILPSNELVSYLKTLKEKSPNTVLITTTWGYKQLLSVFSGPQIDGMIVTTFSALEMNEPYKTMNLKFGQNYSLKPTFVTGLAYNAMDELYRAVKASGSKRDQIADYLDTPRYFDGSYGLVYMDEYGDSFIKYYYIYEINDNKLNIKTEYLVENFPDEN